MTSENKATLTAQQVSEAARTTYNDQFESSQDSLSALEAAQDCVADMLKDDPRTGSFDAETLTWTFDEPIAVDDAIRALGV